MSEWDWIMVLLLIPLVIIMMIVYLRTQKIFTLAFSVSALTYIIGIFFIIDKLELGKNTIFLLLIFSAILMVGVGIYLTRGKKKHVKRKNKK